MRYFVAFGLSLCLQACGGYWYARPELAGPVRAVVEVENIECRTCALSDSWGLWDVGTGVIQIKRGLSAEDRDCVLRHEKYHAEGYDHDFGWRILRLNCGGKE